MQRSESGQGYGKAIFAFAIFALVIFIGIRTVPVYVDNYQLTNFIRDLAVKATVERPSNVAVQDEVVARAQSLELPVTGDNVKVSVTSQGVTIDVDYTVPIDLKLYTLTLHFTPSAQNRSL